MGLTRWVLARRVPHTVRHFIEIKRKMGPSLLTIVRRMPFYPGQDGESGLLFLEPLRSLRSLLGAPREVSAQGHGKAVNSSDTSRAVGSAHGARMKVERQTVQLLEDQRLQ